MRFLNGLYCNFINVPLRTVFANPVTYMKLNKRKRLIWFKEQLETKEDFANIVFTDECTVQLEHHSHICFRKSCSPVF